VFGASDEVLGALESGMDIEKRIAQVYQGCRTAEEIQGAFDRLQVELDESISAAMLETRQTLLENFDEEVHERLRIHKENSIHALNQRQQHLLNLARNELGREYQGHVHFDDEYPRFRIDGDNAVAGHYNLNWREAQEREEQFFSEDHLLAKVLIQNSLRPHLPCRWLYFTYPHDKAKISALESFIDKSGWLEVSVLSVDSLEQEEFLVYSAHTDEGEALDDNQCQRLLNLNAEVGSAADTASNKLGHIGLDQIKNRIEEVDTRNGHYFDEEVSKLDRWADDLKFGLEREIKALDKEIREARSRAGNAGALIEKLTAQKELKNLESKRNQRRRDLYDAQDSIDGERDTLISGIEKQLKQQHTVQSLFTIRWRLG
jgi:adenine-specific DNA-methyltransferase